MTDATQTATTTDAREASMARVTTQDQVLSKLVPQQAAPASGATSETEPKKDGEEHKPKKSAAERIQELAGKRKEAEARANAAEREAADLRARLDSLSANAKPLEDDVRPLRPAYATEDEYLDAVAAWGARKEIAKREREAAEARNEAEQAEIAQNWSKRQDAVMKALPDYAEVIGKSEVQVPAHVHAAILESEQGPQIAYYLALHPEEVRRYSRMRPAAAILHIASLARDLSEIESEETAGASKGKEDPDDKGQQGAPQVKKPKAPPPMEPVRGAPSTAAAGNSSYEEYKRRRQAEKRK